MSEITNSKNVITSAYIDAEGNVIVGDGNNVTVINLKEAAQYKALEAEIIKLNKDFEKAQTRIIQYPDDSGFREDLLSIAEIRSQKERDLETLKNEVIKLADDFQRIPINTERLRIAKMHFENGEFAEARAVLDAEVMNRELDDLESQEKIHSEKLEVIKSQKLDKANEFLILARMTATDFDNPDWFKMTVNFFEQSVRSDRNTENLFAFAYFLHHHNYTQESEPLYRECLRELREHVNANPKVYQPQVAHVLNNIANLLSKKNKFNEATNLYKETLNIRRGLSQDNPEKYLPELAETLYNIGINYKGEEKITEARLACEESLLIRRYLAEKKPHFFLPKVAQTLNVIAGVYVKLQEYPQALYYTEEALNIYKSVVKTDQYYLPDLGDTLNNLGVLYFKKGDLNASQSFYEQSLNLRRQISLSNPYAHLPYVSYSLRNLANVYKKRGDVTQVKLLLEEAVDILLPFAKREPEVFQSKLDICIRNLRSCK